MCIRKTFGKPSIQFGIKYVLHNHKNMLANLLNIKNDARNSSDGLPGKHVIVFSLDVFVFINQMDMLRGKTPDKFLVEIRADKR